MKTNIEISTKSQRLILKDSDGHVMRKYSISSSKYGLGESFGSFQTPRGRHIIRAKIGKGCPVNTVFVERRVTGEIYSEKLKNEFPDRDWILTRILWLSGIEMNFNRLGAVDTMRRYIYLHGSPDSAIMGTVGSIGCIRMKNIDIIELYELVSAGSSVVIY